MLVKNTIYQQKDRLKFIVSNASEVSREIPQILEYIESEESTNLEDILINAHLQGYQFIIESTWDWGYDVFLLNKSGDICELKTFNSYEANDIAEWIDVEMNSYGRNSRYVHDKIYGK